MATYKVPQDVEADDKLIGPFSFRQFIYLIIVVMAGALAWGLAQVFIGLVIIPLPVILLFGALALPLRKDQPMEIYLAALISFYLKPHRRLWDADGIESLIEITAPKTVEKPRIKNLTQEDADQRFGYLAGIVDSQGWAVHDGAVQVPNSAMNTDVFYEAQQTQDVLDVSSTVAQGLDQMMTKSAERLREEALQRMRTPPPAPVAPPPPAVPVAPPAPVADPAAPSYNPYPTQIHQAVVQPVDDPTHQFVPPTPVATDPAAQSTPKSTSTEHPSADIMNLANNSDLSIETIAREANRIQKKDSDLQEEVVVSLR